mmetsp:Transcript_8199/g.20310  ORF Transcript_8199/g.20310 Transcript_8199/m.20310 type:complete len:288 (-) Transcript_8199:261-1124(-)
MHPLKTPPKTGSKNWLKFMTHTRTQMPVMTCVSMSPNSSSFWLSGVFSASSEASVTADWIFPISVAIPVAVTTPMAFPPLIVVPANTMFFWSEIFSPLVMASQVFRTVSDSPVRAPSSLRRVAVTSLQRRTSAGARSPTLILTMSPGTSSSVGIESCQTPSRRQGACRDCICLRASRAFSALASCQTPTMALMMRIRRITAGSTKASTQCSTSSKKARTNESRAAARRIWTSLSSNCSRTNCQRGVFSSCSSSLDPWIFRSSETSASESPRSRVTLCSFRTSSTDTL